MCGRFTNRYSWSELVRLYRITEPYIHAALNIGPRYNFAPMQRGPVVRLDRDGNREPVMMRWGLVPSWSKDETKASSMINAKCETVAEKPAYRSAFRSRPCLVVADGFYEWKKVGAKEKQPYFITLKDNEPFAFAGLWEFWRAKDAPKEAPGLETFTILTTGPNALCAPIHDRMPVILDRSEWDRWLSTPEERAKLLRPYPAERMECWPIGKAVGSVRNDDASLIKRVVPAP